VVSPDEYAMQTIFDVQLGLELQARIGHTFRSISETNHRRAVRWHKGGLDEWSALEWAGAMCGEAGEVANVCKKLKRLEDGISQKRDKSTGDELIAKLKGKVADVFLYLDLICQRYGIDMRAAIVSKFNLVSEREGFPERL
jgi:NTP pyrophosphatase (non-canonical NTP hydrolase)